MNINKASFTEILEEAGINRKKLISEVLARAILSRGVDLNFLDVSRMSRDRKTDGTEIHFLDDRPIAEFYPFKVNEETGNVEMGYKEFELEEAP